MAHLSDRQKAELVRQHLDGVPWTRIAEHSGVTVRTLQRWAARVEAGQLARPPRRDKGASRTPAELVTAIEALAVRRPTPTIAYIHRRVGDVARDRGLPAPGYTTVRHIVHALEGLDLWAYSPLLTGAYVRADRPLSAGYDHPGTTRRLQALAAVADELGVTRNQVVLAWLLGHTPAVHPILGVSSVAQLSEAMAARDLVLDASTRARLDDVR